MPHADHAWPFQERRKHPRMEASAAFKAHTAPPKPADPPQRLSLWEHVLRLLSGRARPDAVPESYGEGRVRARADRLPKIGDRLEAILLELDELEAWREAADVCSAVERIRAGRD
jgi:hypothetical protein